LTTFIDHRHTPHGASSAGVHQGVVQRVAARTDAARSITNQYRQKGARRRPPDGKTIAVRGGDSNPIAGAGIAEVSSFRLTGSFSRRPLARQSLEQPGSSLDEPSVEPQTSSLVKEQQIRFPSTAVVSHRFSRRIFPSNTGETAESYGG